MLYPWPFFTGRYALEAKGLGNLDSPKIPMESFLSHYMRYRIVLKYFKSYYTTFLDARNSEIVIFYSALKLFG